MLSPEFAPVEKEQLVYHRIAAGQPIPYPVAPSASTLDEQPAT